MLTDQDIDRIMAVMASKADVLTLKDDFRDLSGRMDRVEDTLHGVVTGIERLASAIEGNAFEYAAMGATLDRHDRWIHELADQAQVKLVA